MQTISTQSMGSFTTNQVSGGFTPGPNYTPPWRVLFPVLGPAAAVGAAFAGGFAVGTYLNNQFGISEWIVNQLE